MRVDESKWVIELFSFFVHLVGEDEEQSLSVILDKLREMTRSNDPKPVIECQNRILRELEDYTLRQVGRSLGKSVVESSSYTRDSAIRMQGGT